MSKNSVRTEAVNSPLSEVWEKGGEGGVEALAEEGSGNTGERRKANYHPLYADETSACRKDRRQ